MNTIKRKVTTNLTHLNVGAITGAQAFESCPPVISYSKVENGSFIEEYNNTTVETYERVRNGVGSIHHDLSNGLRGASRFKFVFMLKDCKVENSDNTVKLITGVHAVIDDAAGVVDVDHEAELKMPLPKNYVVVDFHDSGEIDLVACARKLTNLRFSILRSLEALPTINYRTRIKIGEKELRVHNMFGTRVVFDAK